MRYKIMACIIICLLVLGGCSQSPDEALLARALEDIKEPLTIMDNRFASYENALAVIAGYIETPSAEALEAAKTVCITATGEISELPTPVSALTEEERGGLIKLGVNMADYDALFMYGEYHKQSNAETLTLLLDYLSKAPALDEMLGHTVEFNIRLQELTRQIEFIGVNALLCGQSGEALEDFKTGFLSGLAAFGADGLPWETDKGTLEAKAEYLFVEMEAAIEGYASMVGEQYWGLTQDRAAYRESLLEAGYSPEEADAILADITE